MSIYIAIHSIINNVTSIPDSDGLNSPLRCPAELPRKGPLPGGRRQVCYYGENSDRINLEIDIDGSWELKASIPGATMCYEWVLPMLRLSALLPTFSTLNSKMIIG